VLTPLIEVNKLDKHYQIVTKNRENWKTCKRE